jgi:3-oxoacyl-[acyl-carrier-protein] synthase II
MRRDVWITGIGLVSSLGEGVEAHWHALAETDPKPVIDASVTPPFPIHPLIKLELDKQIPRRADQRQMEAWQRIGTYAAGLALSDAGVAGKLELLSHTHAVIAADGGERDIAADGAILETLRDVENAEPALNKRLASDLRPTLFLAQLPNLLAGNVSIVHNVTGSSRTFMGEEIAGVSAVEVAWRRIAAGQGDLFLVGGAALAGRKDTALGYSLGGTMWAGDYVPVWRRAVQGGGSILGSVGAFLVLEAPEHAKARGREPYARLAAVRSDMTTRKEGAVRQTLLRQFQDAVPAGGPVNVISAATGVGQPTREEHAALAELLAGRRVATVRAIGSMIGRSVSATFPAITGLAALAVKRHAFFRPFEPDELETPPAAASDRVVVTSVGMSAGEGLGLVTAVD